jgi:hypothetical protein
VGDLGRMALLKDIWSMLRKCARGYTREQTNHYWCVMYNGRAYPSLPKGAHEKQKKKGQKQGRAEIEIGYVRHMIRQLEIDEACAKKHLALG